MLIVDARWIGSHGIGRFAAEVLDRCPFPCRNLRGGPSPASPFSPAWLTAQLLPHRKAVFFSPGFIPPLYSSGQFIFSIFDLIHLRDATESTASKRWFYRMIVRPAARRAFRIVTVSEYSKGEIVEWAGIDEQKVIVAGSGVSANFTPQGPVVTRRRPYIFYLGNRKAHKNIHRLLLAYERSGLAGDFDLLLSGTPDHGLASTLETTAAREGVQFAGAIAEPDLPSYLRGAATVVMPSLREGFGLPALEGMACGTPVVAAAVTSLPEVVGDAGLLIDPYDVESIADGLRRAATDSELRCRMQSAGLSRAKLFTWERTAQIVWDVVGEASTDHGAERLVCNQGGGSNAGSAPNAPSPQYLGTPLR